MTNQKLTYDYYICVELYREESMVAEAELRKKDAYQYLSEEVREEICENFNCADLYMYFHEGDFIEDMELELLGSGVARVHVTPKRKLTKEEQEELRQFLSVQMSDGWGEGIGSELFVHEDSKGKYTYSVAFQEKPTKTYIDSAVAREARKNAEEQKCDQQRREDAIARSQGTGKYATCRYCAWYDREVEENGLKFCRFKKEFTAITICESFVPCKE